MSLMSPKHHKCNERVGKGRVCRTVEGVVQKVITPHFEDEPEKVEIALHEADHLYREVRLENTMTDEHGRHVALKRGAHVDVTLEAEEADTVKKNGQE